MNSNATSYFAGVATVVVAISVGFAGGAMILGGGSRQEPPNRVQRVISSAPIASNGVEKVAATETAAAAEVRPAEVKPAELPHAPVPATQVPAVSPVPSAPVQAATAEPQPAAPIQPAVAKPVIAKEEAAPVVAREETKPQLAAREENSKPSIDSRNSRAEARRNRDDRRDRWAADRKRRQDIELAADAVRRLPRDGVTETSAADGDNIFQLNRTPRTGFFGEQ